MGFIGDMFSSDKGAGYQGSGTGQRNAEGAINTAAMQNMDWTQAIQQGSGKMNAAANRSQGGLNQQQQILNQLGQSAQGKGPNPALAQLNATTGRNIEQQAALMAGQRGSGANTGLISKQAAMQGADIQQQATGQAAVQAAQQQIAAQGLQQSAMQAYNQAAQGFQGLTQQQQQAVMNAQAQQNATNVAMQSNINNANAGIANTNTQGQQGIVGGILGGIGSIFGLAEGGIVPDEGDELTKGTEAPSNFAKEERQDAGGPGSHVGKFLNEAPAPAMPTPAAPAAAPATQTAAPANAGPSPTAQADLGHAPIAFPNEGAKKLEEGVSGFVSGPAKMAKSMMGGGGGGGEGGDSGGLAKMLPMLMMAANQGGKVPKKLSPGGKVNGQAKVRGDSLKNDTVKAMLSPGEIVIPRTVVNGKDPVRASAKFVQAILAKERMKGRK